MSKIKHGRYYLTRSGDIVGPVSIRDENVTSIYRVVAEFTYKPMNRGLFKEIPRINTWTIDGCFNSWDGRNPMDLMKEVDPPPTQVPDLKETIDKCRELGKTSITSIEFNNVSMSTTKEEHVMTAQKDTSLVSTITDAAKSLREKVRPYDKYIIMAAVIIAIDYFVFDGKISEKTKEIFKRLSNKLINALDKVIDRIGGE